MMNRHGQEKGAPRCAINVNLLCSLMCLLAVLMLVIYLIWNGSRPLRALALAETTDAPAVSDDVQVAPANPMAATVQPAVRANEESPSATPSTPTPPPADEGADQAGSRRALKHAMRIKAALSRNNAPMAGLKIGIDPGHQDHSNSDQEPVSPGSSETKAKVSSGTQGVSTRVPEYIVNLDVSLLLRDRLEELGAQVYMTRETNDIDISNVERAQMMNELGVDVVLRIHCNGSSDSSVKGISLFVKPSGEGAEESYQISEALLPAMVAETGAHGMGIYQRDSYSGLNWSQVPSVLVEMGFMSNEEEDQLLNDPAYQEKLVNGMVQGLADYFGCDLSDSAAAQS